MARVKIRLPVVDNEIIFAYAKTNRISEMQTILATTNLAQVD